MSITPRTVSPIPNIAGVSSFWPSDGVAGIGVDRRAIPADMRGTRRVMSQATFYDGASDNRPDADDRDPVEPLPDDRGAERRRPDATDPIRIARAMPSKNCRSAGGAR